MNLDGVLVIDKPSGPTSHDVVAAVRRACGVHKIGHTGTLDPLATGVLPLVIGRATRLARFMTAVDKSYEATIRLGVTSDTFDAAGAAAPAMPGAISVSPDRIARSEIEAALEPLRGSYLQTPPPFSAKKIAGVRAYRHARRGTPVMLEPVPVTVHHLEIVDYEGTCLRVRVDCSAGFYVRSLADTLGRRLGCGGRLDALRRVRSGAYTLADATPLEQVVQSPAAITSRLRPMRDLLESMPAFVIDGRGVDHVTHGREVGPDVILAGPAPADPAPDSSVVRLLDGTGALVCVAEPRGRPGFLHPVVVLI